MLEEILILPNTLTDRLLVSAKLNAHRWIKIASYLSILIYLVSANVHAIRIVCMIIIMILFV